MEKHKLPSVRRGIAPRQEFAGLASDVDTFLPRTLSKQAAKRERAVLEETRIRVTIMKARGVLEKLAADYRFAAKRYELARFIDEADYYVMLIDRAQTRGGKNLAEQAVQQFTDDLYLFVWDLSKTADEQTTDLIKKDLYPETQQERSWLESLGFWLAAGKA